LGQIKLTVRKGTLRKLARFGQHGSSGAEGSQSFRRNVGGSVQAKFYHVFARKRSRALKPRR
jgi:hypothetical protein